MTGLPVVHVKSTDGCSPEVRRQTSKWTSRRVVSVAVGISIGVLVLSAVILSAVYFGYHLTTQSLKEGKVVVHEPSGETFVENVIVRNDEVEITSPGQFAVLNDYNKFLSVFKVDWESGARCYVSNLNISVVGTPRGMENKIKEGEQYVDPSSPVVEYVGSGRLVDLSILSARAKALCAGTTTEWLSSTQEENAMLHSRSKRCSGGEKGKKGKGGRKITIRIKITIVIKVERSCKNNK